MKVSTNYMFDRATQRMTAVQQRLNATQARLADGKQILSPSDAPEQTAAVQRLHTEIAKQQGHSDTLNLALNRFGAEEVAISSSFDVMARIKELTLSAANDTVGPAGMGAIAVEMRGLRDELVSLANMRDDSGNYLFAGTTVNTRPYVANVNGEITFQGDQTQTEIPAGVERDVVYARSGSDVFVRVKRDGQGVSFFKALDDLIRAIDPQTPGQGSSADIDRGLSELEQMEGSLTIALAAVGSDQRVVQSQQQVIETDVLRLQTSLSDIEDLDYTEAVTKMSKDSLALQAAQASFAKISQMTLFDYIKG